MEPNYPIPINTYVPMQSRPHIEVDLGALEEIALNPEKESIPVKTPFFEHLFDIDMEPLLFSLKGLISRKKEVADPMMNTAFSAFKKIR